MKAIFSSKRTTNRELLRLKQELIQARRELSDAYTLFNEALDPALIENAIYRISAERARCDYLLRALKTHQT